MPQIYVLYVGSLICGIEPIRHFSFFSQGRRRMKRSLKDIIHIVHCSYTDKKENRVFLRYKEIHRDQVANSYLTNGLLLYGEIFTHFLIY
jgi:hypothetical protein